MPSREGSNLRPLWRIRHVLNRQEVKSWGRPTKEILLNCDRSRNVYENKQNDDKMSPRNADISAEVKRVLQKIAGFEGQICRNWAFRAVFFAEIHSDK
jgi:hypothetical protein